MQNMLRNMLVPAMVVAMTAANILGPDITRKGDIKSKATAFQSISGPLNKADTVFDNIKPDTVTTFDLSVKANDRYAGSVYRTEGGGNDSLARARRDSIKVPDSLRLTDPFLWKYYVAIKDSLAHRETVDSLRAAGDSLDWPRVDSLYLLDSAKVAKEKFERWYSSLTRQQRRKYDVERMIPIKQHRMDSILNVKDSLKALRDSILEERPRILDTYFLTDSLQYTRLVTWTHERRFHQLSPTQRDTSYNYWFNDLPIYRQDVNAIWGGVSGSPAESMDWFKRDYSDVPQMYQNAEPWTYSPQDLPFFNTKTPYTELAYWGTLFADKQKESDNIHVLTTQNLFPEWNITLGYDRFGGNGMLNNESTTNKTLVVATNYVGKKYMAHAGYIYNMMSHQENGGVQDRFWVRDTTVDAREIAVRLKDASNLYKKNTVFLDQQYRIPFTFISRMFSKKDKADTLSSMPQDSLTAALPAADSLQARIQDEDITTAFIGHSSEYSVFRKVYQDNLSTSSDSISRAFYNDRFYLNPGGTLDSMRVMRLDNKFFLRLQPWKDDAVISKLNVGIGDRITNWYLPDNRMLSTGSNTTWNSVYLYAGAEGRFKKYIHWDATGSYTFLGNEFGDFDIGANASFSMYPFRRARTSPVTLKLHFDTSLQEPDYYQQHMISNHYRWDNDFGKITTTRLKAGLDIPRWKFNANVGYALMANNIWYDSTGTAKQNASAMNILSASVRKEFVIANFLHLDNRVLFQLSSDQDVVPLPMVALNLKYFVQFNIVKDVLQMQIGANAWMNTEYYAPAWNPALGVFQNQKEAKYGNNPYFDVFVNMQWKRACIFVKLENAGLGWPLDRADYFSAHNQIRTQRALKFGIFWPFYLQASKNASVGGSSSGASGASGGRSSGGAQSGRGRSAGGLRSSSNL